MTKIKTIKDLENPKPAEPAEPAESAEPAEPAEPADLGELTRLREELDKANKTINDFKEKYNKALEANNDLFMRLTSKRVNTTNDLDDIINGKVGI